MSGDWNPELYQSRHAFVWELGEELVTLLAAQPGERILDLGCGTGQLTAAIARAGATVTGIDPSPAMIEQARLNCAGLSGAPSLDFVVGAAEALPYRDAFDAVFSNAALHWVLDAEAAAAGIARALRPRGRFVGELGGAGNLQELIEAAFRALAVLGVPEARRRNPWYFPSVGVYASLLERHGLSVHFAACLERPTPLAGAKHGLADWVAMFGGRLTAALAPGQLPEFVRLLERFAALRLFHGGQWVLDYRRLRIAAVKPEQPVVKPPCR